MESRKPWSFEEQSKAKHVIKAGDVYGFLTVLRTDGKDAKNRMVYCRCSCGVEKSCVVGALVKGETVSCGHHRASGLCKVHGHKTSSGASRTYSTWRAMIGRCHSETDISYSHYSAKGIAVCERWRKFANFLEDMGERPVGKTIDRINNDLGYFKENCRWATPIEQQCNRPDNRILTFRGVSLAMAEHCRREGMPYNAVSLRIHNGWSVERALTQPVQVKRRKARL